MEILRTVNLKKHFKISKTDYLHAVDGIDLTINKGKTLGVVGESGCGKSTLGRLVLGLIPATEGEVYFQEKNILEANRAEKKANSTNMQIVFQDPYASLNPRMSVFQLIAEPLIRNKLYKSKYELYERIVFLMDKVGLANRYINSYPHEMDGGRRQRVGVARALAPDPQFIVCDEPVSALDVSIQAQILNLLMDMQDENELSYLFITHDLSVVKHISDEILVMYLGQCVERAPTRELFKSPSHPYTQALLSAIPQPFLDQRLDRNLIQGEISNPINPTPGCRFRNRCPYATSKCEGRDIPAIEISQNHYVSCTLFEKDEIKI